MAYGNIAAVVLAAGQGKRFGADKLMVDLSGSPLGLHIGQTLRSFGFDWRFCVCSKGAALMQHYLALGFDVIANDAPEMGQAGSLHLAVNAAVATSADALLVTLADMPFVGAPHLNALLTAGDFTASFDGEKAMPPALFPRALWPELLATRGDQGARDLLHHARLVTAPAGQLRDIDTPADLPASN
jgi:molybdenum cofactor cytidylyltransferase